MRATLSWTLLWYKPRGSCAGQHGGDCAVTARRSSSQGEMAGGRRGPSSQILSLGPDTTMPMIYFLLNFNSCCHVMISICMHSFLFYLHACRVGCQLRESWLALTSRTFLPVKGEPRSYSHGDSYYSVQLSFTDNLYFCGSKFIWHSANSDNKVSPSSY